MADAELFVEYQPLMAAFTILKKEVRSSFVRTHTCTVVQGLRSQDVFCKRSAQAYEDVRWGAWTDRGSLTAQERVVVRQGNQRRQSRGGSRD